MTKSHNLVMEPIQRDLDIRYALAAEILWYIKKINEIYAKADESVDIPRCSRKHFQWITKDLSEYVDEVHRVRCALPRLLSSEPEGLD